MSPNKPRLLVVLGMHRSGTSALGGCLHALGAWMGSRLMPGKTGENDKGFFEHEGVVEINEALLALAGRRWCSDLPLDPHVWEGDDTQPLRTAIRALWQSDFGDAPLQAVKDPRLCLTLPVWLGEWEAMGLDVGFIHMLRQPDEVARSLAKRDCMQPESALRLWRRHTAHAMKTSRAGVVVTYDQLLRDGATTLRQVAGALGVQWPIPLQDAPLNDFLDIGLRHHAVSASAGDEARLYAELALQTSPQQAVQSLLAWADAVLVRDERPDRDGFETELRWWGRSCNELRQQCVRVEDALTTLQPQLALAVREREILTAALDEASIQLTARDRALLEEQAQAARVQDALNETAEQLRARDAALLEAQQALRVQQSALAQAEQLAHAHLAEVESLSARLSLTERWVRDREADVAQLRAEAAQLHAQLIMTEQQRDTIYRYSWQRLRDALHRIFRK